MSEWQPIEACSEKSYPGEYRKRILVYGRDLGCQFGFCVQYPDGSRHVGADGFHGDWKITHWMPLPAPPAVESR